MRRSSSIIGLIVTAASIAAPSIAGAQFTGWVMNGSANVQGNGTLQLTPDLQAQTGSAYAPLQAHLGSFTATFQYTTEADHQYGDVLVPNGDGFSFVVQRDARGTAALGDGGGKVGLGSFNINQPGDAVQPSVAAYFRPYTHDLGITTAHDPDAASNTRMTYDPQLGIIYAPGSFGTLSVFDMMLRYDATAGTLTFSGSKTVGTAASTFSVTRTGVDLAALLGGSTAYFGFTGANGLAAADQRIQNFSVTFDAVPTTTTPEPSSLALLGSGIVGLVPLARRRR